MSTESGRNSSSELVIIIGDKMKILFVFRFIFDFNGFRSPALASAGLRVKATGLDSMKNLDQRFDGVSL